MQIGLGDEDDRVTFDMPASIVHLPWQQRFTRRVSLKPQLYEVIGRLVLRYEDGKAEAISLFHPFGTIKRDEQYATIDMHEVREYVLKRYGEIDKLLR